MARTEDITTQKLIRREFNRRQIDISSTHIQVFQGVVYIKGQMRPIQNDIDSQVLTSSLKRALKAIPQVKDVVFD